MRNEGIKNLLSETFEGPEGNASWFIESKPGSGLFGTIDPLTAKEASVLVEGVTIAAHTDHTHFHLWANNQLLAGEIQNFDWGKSWEIGTVTKGEWEQTLKKLHHEYTKMPEHISEEEELSSTTTNILLGALAHAAYHLGAIRQMVKAIK